MQRVKLVAIAIVSMILSVAAAEGLLRIVHPAPTIFGFSMRAKDSSFQPSANPVLGYTLKPNVRNEAADCHDTFPYTNALGQRDIERVVSRTPGVKRVVMIGDSVVAGHGLCDLNDTISRKLEKHFAGTTEVLNLGVGGYCTLGEVELLRERGLQFSPDLVVLLFVNNDYINSNGALVRSFQKPIPSVVRTLFVYSHIFRWVGLELNLYKLRSDLDAKAAYSEHRSAVGVGNIESGMELLHTLSQQYQFKVLVALWPFFLDSGIREPTPGNVEDESAPLLIETLAAQYGFESQRLAPGFQQDLEKRAKKRRLRDHKPSPRWIYTIGDGTHPSKSGAKVAAQLLEPQVRRLTE